MLFQCLCHSDADNLKTIGIETTQRSDTVKNRYNHLGNHYLQNANNFCPPIL